MASSQTIAEAVENSLNAFNIISKKNLESVAFDQTIKCKITDVTNSDLGEYKVTDGTSTFFAYAEKTDYIKGTLVWVTIPQGDYSKQKIITGKYLESDNSEYYTYVSPLDSFINISGNLIEPGTVKTTGLIANGEVEEITLWSVYGRELKGYDRLAIQAGFKSWLKQLNVQSGTYGIRLDITSRVMGTSQTSNDRKFYSIVLNTNDFYGDVYNFETFYNQVKVIDISMIDCIDSMSLVFYQGKDFKVSNGSPLQYPNSIQDDIDLTNIWVDEPFISVGYDVNRFTTDTILLYSLDSMTYASFLSERMKDTLGESLSQTDFDTYEEYIQAVDQIHNDDGIINQTLNRLNRKDMKVRWIHFTSEDSQPIVIDDVSELPNNAILHWYHYKLDEGIKDQLAGSYWEEIPSLRNSFEYKNFYPDIANQTEKFKVIIELPSQESKVQEIYYNNMFGELFDTSEKVSDETYYEWVCRGLDKLEELKMEVVKILSSQNKLEAEEDKILIEYYNALVDEALILGLINQTKANQYHNEINNGQRTQIDELKPTDAKSNAITEKYRKKMLNVKTELEGQESSYIELYNAINKVLSEVNYYYSDILEFTCEDLLPNNMTLQLIQGLQLSVDSDGYNGRYRFYNEEGQILSKKESQKKRIITASWTSIVTGDRALDGIERIEWYIPTKNTMIEYPKEGVEFSLYDEYPIGDKITFDTTRDRQLYTYNKVSDTYEAVLPAAQFDRLITYYVKNNTTYAPPSASHPDTFIIVRKGQSFQDHEPGTEEPSESGQVFRVKEFYSPTFTNNTIKCIVYKNNSPFTAEASLVFGPSGINGTDYLFELEIANKIQALTAGQSSPESTITIIPHLYDYDGQDIISKHLNKLKYSWWSPSDPKINIDGIEKTDSTTGQVYYTGNNINGSIDLVLPTNVTIEDAQYHILYAELTNAVTTGIQSSNGTNQSITLTTFKPIAVRSSERYVAIDGADRVSYSPSGTDPSYYKDPYILYIYKDKATIPIEDDNSAEEKPVIWQVALGPDTIGAVAGSVSRNFYPTLTKQNALVPASYYLQDNGKNVAVNCIHRNNHDILWTQPLYIYQNSYSSAMLNSWDGKLTIDEENGTILSTVVGAGAKDEKNRYNGVLMGDLRDVDNTPIFGLYGYHEGTQSFGLKIDGTTFIGKSGKGQINFDGNSGRISSLSYNLAKNQPQGMLIDLDDGYIDAYGANLNSVNYISGNRSYTISQVLDYQKQILQDEINSYDVAIASLNEWADRVLIQRYQNRKRRAQEKYNKAQQIINDFATQNFANDYERLKYLQDNNATYLINDDNFEPVYTPSQSRIRISTTDPYLSIISEAKTELMRVSREAYFLQTDNFSFAKGDKAKFPYQNIDYLKYFKDNESASADNAYGTGLLFDLSHGYLMGYNFKLRSVNNGQEGSVANRALKDSYFELNSSGDPFLVIHYKTSNSSIISNYINKGYLNSGETSHEKDLIKISTTEYILQSFNYFAHKFATTEITGQATNGINPKQVGAGVLLDLTNGKLIGHDFEITAINTGSSEPAYTGSYIWISSNGDPYFRIHYQNIPNAADRNNYGTAGVWEKYDTTTGVLTNQNINLINISKSAWEINSKDFQRPGKSLSNNKKSVGKGIHIDLEGDAILSVDGAIQHKGSIIEAYSFGLDAYRPGLSAQDSSSRIRINSAATGKKDASQKVTSYSVNRNYLAMPTEQRTYKNEDQIWNVINNRYKDPTTFNNAVALKEGDLQLSPIVVDSSRDFEDNPLMVGGLFSVSWDGKVNAGWVEITQGGRIGPYTLSSYALYTNNGKLADGEPFINNTSYWNTKQGVNATLYFGNDGLSFNDKFVIYKLPINKYQSSNGSDNLNRNSKYALKRPLTTFDANGYINTSDVYDYVTTGKYTTSEVTQYFQNIGHSYDQGFIPQGQPNGASDLYILRDLSFFLNGNSVLNGKTAINGNTYIYGNLQIGIPRDMAEEKYNSSKDAIIAYAHTTIHGVFRTTGRAFIGDHNINWYTDSEKLRDYSRTDGGTISELIGSNINSTEPGFIVYRNSFIAGYLRVAGSMTVGESNINLTGTSTYNDSIKNNRLRGDFSAYVLNAKFFGDMEVAAGFIAGTLSNDSVAGDGFPKTYFYTESGRSLEAVSGIRAKNIFLGRDPATLATQNNGNYRAAQSKLSIYADVYQSGSFVAGKFGSKIELYAAESYNATTDRYDSDPASIIMNSNGIAISTQRSKPMSITTNGGNFTVDATGPAVGNQKGDVYIKANYDNNMHFVTYDSNNSEIDYIKFTKGELAIQSHDSFKLDLDGRNNTISGHVYFGYVDNTRKFELLLNTQDGENKILLDNSGLAISTVGANFDLKVGSGNYINEFQLNSNGIKIVSQNASKNNTIDIQAGYNTLHFDKDEIKIERNNGTDSNSIIMNNTAMSISGTGADFTLETNNGNNKFNLHDEEIRLERKYNNSTNNLLLMDNSGVKFESSGSDFSIKANNNEFIINNTEISIKRKNSNGTTVNELTMNSNGTTFKSTGSDFSVTAGKNTLELSDNGIKISTDNNSNSTLSFKVGCGSFVIDNTIKLSNTHGDYISISDNLIDIHSEGSTASDGTGIKMTGTTRISGSIYADNLKFNSDGTQIGGNNTIGDTNGGISSGSEGTFLGSWQIVGYNFQSTKTDFILNATDASIDWGSDKIDAKGNGNSGTGIRIQSPSSVSVQIDGATWLILSNNSSKIGRTGNSLDLDGTLNLGQGSNGSSSSYYINDSGVGHFSKIEAKFNAKDGTEYDFSDLGKLAFADDIKKKIKLNLYGKDYYGNYEYINTLDGDAFYTINNNNPTLYKIKSGGGYYGGPADIYKKSGYKYGTYYEEVYSGGTAVYTENGSHSEDVITSNVYGPYSKNTTHNLNFNADFYVIFDYSTVDIDDYSYYGRISEVNIDDYISADIDDIADEVDLEQDLLTRKRFRWHIKNQTSDELTFEGTQGNASDTIEINNNDYSNGITIDITSENFSGY